MEIIKEEIRHTWKTFHIPTQHQILFEKRVFGLSKAKIALIVVREIDNIEKGSANISEILDSIRDREYLLKKLLEEVEKINMMTDKVDLEIAKHECADILKRLRETTLNTVENICT